jgi:diaminohydroxyphosphoribosylaminopyrimidine deaminase / 5-amino-6-(5-phosphoribosylamino)uracil reductase
LLEGGSRLAGAFFDADAIDALRIFIAPLVAGGENARQPLGGIGVDKIADAANATITQVKVSGGDILVSAHLKEW